MCGITAEIAQLNLTPPHKIDVWLMAVLVHLGCTTTELLRLNRVRVHQRVLFISHVMDAQGNALDKWHWTQRQWDETWS